MEKWRKGRSVSRNAQSSQQRAKAMIAGMLRTKKQWADPNENIVNQVARRIRQNLAIHEAKASACRAALKIILGP